MKTGLFGQTLTLMDSLKASTFAPHARLHTAPFFEALAACQLPLESYVGQLRALAVIHGVLEQALESCPGERVASVWQSDMRRLPVLQQDLRFFEPRAVADLREAVDQAFTTAERLRLRSVEQPLSLLAFLYVLEGSALGAVVLHPLYAKAFLLAGGEGLSYLNNEAPDVGRRWARYKERMNALRLSAGERETMTQDAAEFFTQLATLFHSLYPFNAESRTFDITSINPEAGRHPVPADAREVEAALKAADLCWKRFPYYEHRYGERGQRFARSDAAWLATLHPFDAAQISQQVQWLGRVLAGRGMPTYLLQVQLEMLAAELSAAVPEKQAAYETYSRAAIELIESRRAHLDDGEIQALAAAFDQAVGPEWSARFPHTGELLACAIADELEGSDLAVESLKAWMTDPSRFSDEWIGAVEATLAEAHKMARTPLHTRSNLSGAE